MAHVLIDRHGNQVKPGAIITDFRGEDFTLQSFRVISPPSTGRVSVVRYPSERGSESGMEFYPEVFNLKIVNSDDLK